MANLLRAARTDHGTRSKVLVVGGGAFGAGTQILADDPGVDLIETDVYLGPRTRIVCDGHDLPFRNASFDAVICQAVLEHVMDPPRVVAEIHRVLRPNGLVYSEVPFMQPVHEGAFDVTRYTAVGHRRLLREFDEISLDVVAGPGMSLAWSLRYFALALAGPRRIVRAAVNRLMPLATWWLVATDRWLVRSPAAFDAASGTAFLGRRRDTPVPDAETVAGYRGMMKTPQR
jgi:SAM-dependent methyltransferase